MWLLQVQAAQYAATCIIYRWPYSADSLWDQDNSLAFRGTWFTEVSVLR